MCDQKRTFIAITVSGLKLTPSVKPIDWRGTSKKVLLSFCDEVKKRRGLSFIVFNMALNLGTGSRETILAPASLKSE